MLTVSIVSTLAGVSSLFGLLALLAYFFIGQKAEKTASMIDVMGHRVDLASEIELIKQFGTDAAKLKALKQRHDQNSQLAEAILSKIKGNVDVHHGAKSRDRRCLISAIVFLVPAMLGFLSPIIRSAPSTPGAEAPAAAPESAAEVRPPVPTATLSPTSPVYASRWESNQPGGAPYSQAFSVTTENRHHRSNAMASETITLAQLTGQPGIEKRITRAEYSCAGGACPWSVNPAGKAEGHHEIHPQGVSITWKRVWDGYPVVETNTVFYDVYTRYCSANCP